MKVVLEYNNYCIELKDILIHLLPKKKTYINDIFKNIQLNNYIYITNDDIHIINEDIWFDDALFLDCTDFVKYINMLNKGYNIVAININSDDEYEFIIENLKNNHIIDDYWGYLDKNELKIMISNKKIYVITDDIYDTIFNKIPLIDVKQLIRSIKLKQLL